MKEYLDLIAESYSGYWNYLVSEISSFHWENYFYGLIAVSIVVWVLELIFP